MKKITVKITNDNFVWKVLSKKEALNAWDNNSHELYILYNDDSEGAVEERETIIEAYNKGLVCGIELGFLTPKKPSIPTTRVHDISWLKPYGEWAGEYEQEAYDTFIEFGIEISEQSEESWFDIMKDDKDNVYIVSYDSPVTAECGRGIIVNIADIDGNSRFLIK